MNAKKKKSQTGFIPLQKGWNRPQTGGSICVGYGCDFETWMLTSEAGEGTPV
uniref:Uncharacterized protein n=1 Tax=Arion vulgaris TaxID=1028688 RepID=A0A0B6ZLX7_9EUPU